MREGSDAPHEGEGKDDDLEEFRKELVEGAGEPDKALNVREGSEEMALPEDEKEGMGRLTQEDLEEFRRQVGRENGPDDLSEDTPEGHLYKLTKEEMEAGSEGKVESEAASETESKGSGGTDKETMEDMKEASVPETTECKEAAAIPDHGDATENPLEQAKSDEETAKDARDTKELRAVEVYVRNDDQLVTAEQTKLGGSWSPGSSVVETPSLRHLQSEETLIASITPVIKSGDSGREGDVVSKENATIVEDERSTPLLLRYPDNWKGHYNQEGSQLVVTQEQGPPHETEGTAHREERELEPIVVRRVVEHMGSPMLVVQGSEFPKDVKENVFAIIITRESESSARVLYCNHTSKQQKTYLDLRHIGAEVGEEVRINNIEPLLLRSFAKEYNMNPPTGLENTRLMENGGSLSLGIERGELKFVNFALRTREGKAVLDGELAGVGHVKIAKSSEGFDFRLRDHSQVESIWAEGSSCKFEYRRTMSDQFPHVKRVPVEGKFEHQSSEFHKVEIDSTGVKIAEPWDFSTRMVKFEVSSRNQMAAWKYRLMASSKSERRVHIGDIGQSVAEIALRQSGFKILSKEPVGEPIFSRTHVSERKGPDLVCEKDEQAVIVMVKHWRESYKGLANGEAEVNAILGNEKRLAMLEEKIGKEISGGIAMEIHWSYREGRGIIYLKYIKSGRA